MDADIQVDIYSAGPNSSVRVIHKPTGLMASAPTKDEAMELLRTLLADADDADESTGEVVSVYDQRTVSYRPPKGSTTAVDDDVMTVRRAIAVYRKPGAEPWEFSLVKLTGVTSGGEEDVAILIRSDDWPEWLARFVDENMPEVSV